MSKDVTLHLDEFGHRALAGSPEVPERRRMP